MRKREAESQDLEMASRGRAATGQAKAHGGLWELAKSPEQILPWGLQRSWPSPDQRDSWPPEPRGGRSVSFQVTRLGVRVTAE